MPLTLPRLDYPLLTWPWHQACSRPFKAIQGRSSRNLFVVPPATNVTVTLCRLIPERGRPRPQQCPPQLHFALSRRAAVLGRSRPERMFVCSSSDTPIHLDHQFPQVQCTPMHSNAPVQKIGPDRSGLDQIGADQTEPGFLKTT